MLKLLYTRAFNGVPCSSLVSATRWWSSSGSFHPENHREKRALIETRMTQRQAGLCPHRDGAGADLHNRHRFHCSWVMDVEHCEGVMGGVGVTLNAVITALLPLPGK